MSEREQFEAWASDNNEWPQCIERSGDSYKLMQTKLKWEAWRAARAQPAQMVPVEPTDEMLRAIRRQRSGARIGKGDRADWKVWIAAAIAQQKGQP